MIEIRTILYFTRDSVWIFVSRYCIMYKGVFLLFGKMNDDDKIKERKDP